MKITSLSIQFFYIENDSRKAVEFIMKSKMGEQLIDDGFCADECVMYEKSDNGYIFECDFLYCL